MYGRKKVEVIDMNFGIWQIIYLCMIVLSVGITIAKHGEPKEGNYHAGVTFVSAIIDIVILALGGFFSK